MCLLKRERAIILMTGEMIDDGRLAQDDTRVRDGI